VIRVQLPPAEADRLDNLFRSTDGALRHRLQIVLMAHRGRARQDIATDLGIDRKTVTRWINAYCDDGLDGLRPKKAKGTPE
jgi:transposase